MRVRNLIGWLLVIGAIIGVYVFTTWIYTIVYMQSHYTQQFQSPYGLHPLTLIITEVFISAIVGVTGFLLTRHTFGNNPIKDKIILGVLSVSLASWAIVCYLLVGYPWN